MAERDSRSDIEKQAAEWIRAARDSGDTEREIIARLEAMDRKAADHRAARRTLLAKRIATFAECGRSALRVAHRESRP